MFDERSYKQRMSWKELWNSESFAWNLLSNEVDITNKSPKDF